MQTNFAVNSIKAKDRSKESSVLIVYAIVNKLLKGTISWEMVFCQVHKAKAPKTLAGIKYWVL